CATGTEAADFLARFGPPSARFGLVDHQTWAYDPNPWYAWGWSVIKVRVDDGRVEACWMDD
ncbi:MAG: hypothetical protein H6825_13895, partial [Planctomycetes bacterium]|nr:hypothetical protein [Planctomycetota bacterium]